MSDLIHHFIEQRAHISPTETALLFKDQALDYAGLQREVSAVANGLLALAVKPGEVFGFLGHNGAGQAG